MKKMLNMAGKPQKSGGFTLIEVMIALLLILIGLLGVAGVVVNIIQANTFSRQITTATTLAEEKMETLKGTAYGSLAGGSDTPSQLPSGSQRTWTVAVDTPLTATTTITVTVSFPWKGRNHNVTLQTIIRRP